MKKLLRTYYLFFAAMYTFAQCDAVTVPFQRVRFHDRIKEEQVKCDKADGKADSIIKVGKNEEINLQVTDALTRRINDILCFIESNPKDPSNNEKIRQLNFVEEMVRNSG